MEWITYQRANKLTVQDKYECSYCREDKPTYLLKRGSFVDEDLLFQTYISFVQENHDLIYLGSYPFNGAEVLYCIKCRCNFYKYFNEGSIGGRPEYGIIQASWKFEDQLASCSLRLSHSEIEQVADQFEITDFKPHRKPVQHRLYLEPRVLPPLLAVNQRKLEDGQLIRYDMVGNRRLLHELVGCVERIGEAGASKRYIRLNKKLYQAIERMQFEDSIDISLKLMQNVRKEISHTVHSLYSMIYSRPRHRRKDYCETLDQIQLKIGSADEKLTQLIEEIKACS